MSCFDPLGAVERIAIAEEVVSALRHDVRNRFAIIRNALFYIQRKVGQAELADPRIERFFQVIDDEVVAASALLDDPLKGKLTSCRRPTRTSAAACARAALSCARIADASLRAEVDAGAGDVEVDRDELALAVRCLLENAAEATPAGGVVALHGGAVGERYVIEVVDTGAGIPASERDAVNRPFYTTKEGHVGLGLNIARRVAQRHGGSLTLGSRGQGTSAVIALPLAPEEGGGSP